MRRTTTLKLAVAGTALAALSIGGATAFADTEDSEPAAVVNKNGHEVDEHAADGQARAAEARAQRLEKAAEREADDTETETPETETDTETLESETDAPAEHTDNGNHGGPDEHAGDHPNPKAFENPQEHEPQGPKEGHEPQGPKDGNGPSEHAGDHPNENATDGPGNNGQAQQK